MGRENLVVFNYNSKISPNWSRNILFNFGVLGNGNACTNILMKSQRGTGHTLTYDVDSSHVRIAIFVAFVQIRYFVNHVTDIL